MRKLPTNSSSAKYSRGTVQVHAKKSTTSADVAKIAALKSESGLESALLKLSSLGSRQKPKPPVQEPDRKALQKSVRQKIDDHPTNSRRAVSITVAGQSKKVELEKPYAAKVPAQEDALDMDRAWQQVEAAIKVKSKDMDFVDDDDDYADAEDSDEPDVQTSSDGSGVETSSAGIRNAKPRGFGAPPASISSSSTSQRKQSMLRNGSSSMQSPEQEQRRPIRIYLYAADVASVQQAISDAGLSRRVEIGLDVRECDAVVTAKLSKRGTSINLRQVHITPLGKTEQQHASFMSEQSLITSSI
jgi:hypothetical protein